MLGRNAIRRPRALVGALAILVALPLTSWQGAAQATGPEDTATTIEINAAAPVYGDTITVTAPVAVDPGGAPVSNGQVTFDAAPTQAALWGGGQQAPHVTLDPILLDGGTAYLELDTGTLPFLNAQSQGFWLAAQYDPQEGGTSYASSYNPSLSDPFYVALREPPVWTPFATTTSLTAPASARVGTPVTFDATVVPAAAGTVQFSVDGSPVGAPVPVSGGAASLSHDFATGGRHTVGAAFSSADPAFLGSAAGTATVAVVAPTTTKVTGPDSARVNAPTTLTATVSPATAAGTVSFSVGGVSVGAPVPVESGVASLQHTFAGKGVPRVRASFTPADPAVYEPSSDATGLGVEVSAIGTTVQIAGPDRVVAGDFADFTATVTPRGVPGVVIFRFENRRDVRAPVDDAGVARATHRFVSIRNSPVTATWRPADAAVYQTATAPAHPVQVRMGTTGAEFGAFLTASVASLSYSLSCNAERGGSGVPGVEPAYSLFFFLVDIIFEMLRAVFDFFRLSFKATLCGPGGRGGPAETVSGTVDCQLTETGLACPLDLAAFSQLTITGSMSMPAELAGEPVEIESTLSQVDPETGELTPLASDHGNVRVPRRTVLAGRLAPVGPGVRSVERGEAVAYRLRVRNAGVFTADGVRTCVTVGKGAEIRAAMHAATQGSRACWTLPTLKKGKAAVRTLTVVAHRKGDLRVRALVLPRRSQADPLLLRTLLPVT